MPSSSNDNVAVWAQRRHLIDCRRREASMNFAEAAMSIPHSCQGTSSIYIRKCGAFFRLTNCASSHSAVLNAGRSEHGGDFADLDGVDLHRESPASAAAHCSAARDDLSYRDHSWHVLSRHRLSHGALPPGTAKRRRIVRNSYRLSLNLPSMGRTIGSFRSRSHSSSF